MRNRKYVYDGILFTLVCLGAGAFFGVKNFVSRSEPTMPSAIFSEQPTEGIIGGTNTKVLKPETEPPTQRAMSLIPPEFIGHFRMIDGTCALSDPDSLLISQDIIGVFPRGASERHYEYVRHADSVGPSKLSVTLGNGVGLVFELAPDGQAMAVTWGERVTEFSKCGDVPAE